MPKAMTDLVKYEAARRALAEASTVDEVASIRDRAIAMQTYARMAKDSDLIDKATDIRLRAERRAGEMLAEMRETGQRDDGRGNRNPVLKSQAATPKLVDLGVTKTESSRWQKIAAMPEPEFEQRVAVAKREAVRSVEATTAERTEEKKERRAEREVELAAKIIALPEKRYGVIYADPEWRFEPWSRETGMDRAADNHYPTSELETIKNRSVHELAADDCVLFMWATSPMLKDAIEVMRAWGFRYVTSFVWVKDKIGTGYWFRNKHETLLVGVKGEVPAPAPGTQADSVISAPVARHSEKPEVFYEIIERYFSTLPKIELNARRRRAGWDAWGLEAPGEAA
jgi:N6-adenosine-specific RNA methylase IME4